MIDSLLSSVVTFKNRSLDPDAQHIEFGLFNDHTYATLQFRYTVPHVTVPLEQPVPDAAVTVTIKTEDVKEEVKDASEIPTGIVIKKEPECNQANGVVVKEEKLDEKPEELKAERDADVDGEGDNSNSVPENLATDDAVSIKVKGIKYSSIKPSLP